ncbi:uncharacterized protein BYT42DRAFT_546350 [Radiomyces spectabilis]|uniref:uncharacterized protein n=1 Tax=Radiomyces spectabilis TaxID=64574 RepID=UPI00221E5593|nr:uncharacterized protein BYT42DRAFT_546350 [Radiomyces spectabilis]KAI8377699.1 hypothetical protein BYT42DRAFT_546350 [Radiomyces spectabilis]
MTHPLSKKSKSTSRKRCHSSTSSSASSGSPLVSVFSNPSSSDSSSSSMSPVRIQDVSKRQKSVTDKLVSTAPFTSPGTIPARLSSSQRNVPAFLNKLYTMVDDPSTNDLIRWSPDGASFIVERHQEFAQAVLPRYYKHNTFTSFVRQLNMYDFHKVPHLQQGVLITDQQHEVWEFSNPHFQRNRSDLLVLVTRKRNRENELAEIDNLSLTTVVKDISAIQKNQTTINSDLHDLHRDNEILWQETLVARERYHRHQDAMEKIVHFLNSVYSKEAPSLEDLNKMVFPLQDKPSFNALGDSVASSSKHITYAKPHPTSASSSSSGVEYGANSGSSRDTAAQTTETNMATGFPSSKTYDHIQRTQPLATPDYMYSYKSHQEPPMAPSFQKSATHASSIQPYTVVSGISDVLDFATDSAQAISSDINALENDVEQLADTLGISSHDMGNETYYPMDLLPSEVNDTDTGAPFHHSLMQSSFNDNHARNGYNNMDTDDGAFYPNMLSSEGGPESLRSQSMYNPNDSLLPWGNPQMYRPTRGTQSFPPPSVPPSTPLEEMSTSPSFISSSDYMSIPCSKPVSNPSTMMPPSVPHAHGGGGPDAHPYDPQFINYGLNDRSAPSQSRKNPHS